MARANGRMATSCCCVVAPTITRGSKAPQYSCFDSKMPPLAGGSSIQRGGVVLIQTRTNPQTRGWVDIFCLRLFAKHRNNAHKGCNGKHRALDAHDFYVYIGRLPILVASES